MSARFLAAALAAMAALPAAAQPAGQSAAPALVIQAQPIGKLLDDARAITRTVGGDEAVKKMDEAIEEGLGEKGFAGVDLLRPVVGYANITGAVADPSDLSGVAIVPVTGEKEFVEFLKRLKFDVDPVKGKDGLYAVDRADGGGNVKVRLRVHDRHAFLGINVSDDAMAADKLARPSDLVDPAERGLFAMRSRVDRLPGDYRKQQAEQFEQVRGVIQNAPVPEKARDAIGKLFDYVVKANEQFYTEGESSVARLVYDRAAGEIVYEAGMKAKPGTELAKQIAARKPATNRFAGLVTKETTAAVLAQAPLFVPEIGEAAAAAVEAVVDEVGRNNPPPEPARPVFDAAVAGLARTLKSGDLDVAAALAGPNKDGAFTAIAALTFDDPSKVEQELRALHKTAPEGVRDLIKLDAAKAGGASLHEAAVGAFLPPEAQKVFGDSAVACAAFAPKAVYLAFGPDARAAVTAALAAKPGPAKALDVVVNPARVRKLAAGIDPNAGDQVAKLVGADDKAVSALYVEMTGGDQLMVRMGFNLKLLPRAAAGAVGTRRVEDPGSQD